MSKTSISGIPATRLRSDCTVRYTPASRGALKITVRSKVLALYGEAIRQQAAATLADLEIANGHLELDDFGALPFVLQARIEAAVKGAYPDLQAVSLPALAGHKRPKSSRDRFRRSRLYIPGVQPKMMVNAALHGADGIILDLEDSVAPVEKLSARLIVRNALRVLDFGASERMVRINQGARGRRDLEAIIPEPVQLILAPKVESAEELRAIDQLISDISQAAGRKEPVYLMPILESALGITRAVEIAAASPSNVALAIGLEDYTADMGIQRTEEGRESLYARGVLVNAARAAGLQAIGTVYSDVDNEAGLAAAAREARSLGYDGMGAIHPRQVSIIHAGFAPDEAEIERAQEIVLAFQAAEAQGLGVVALGSKMIDPPVVKRAQRTVDLAVAAGLLSRGWRKNKK